MKTERSGTGASTWPYFLDLIIVLLEKEIKVRYKSHWLGYLWSLANPLAFTFLYFIVFGTFMRLTVPDYPYAAFLITGLFPWQWFANGVNGAPSIFLTNASLIKKLRFPRNFLVLSAVLNEGVHFVLSLPVIAAALLVYKLAPSWSWLIGIPFLLVAQAATIYGLAVLIASLNLFFRDLERLTLLLTTFLFFLTPVVYPLSMIPEAYRLVLYLNPAAALIVGWQQLLLSGELPWRFVLAGCLHALVAFGTGSVVFSRLSWKFGEVV
jgi:lipopolysaccharide transport system permease protein